MIHRLAHPVRVLLLLGGLLPAASLLTVHADGAQNETNRPAPRLRDPFQPFDYIPPEQKKSAREEAMDLPPGIQWPQIPVEGMMRGPDGTYRVVVEGIGVIKAGEILTLPSAGRWFHWEIREISTTSMRTVRLGITADPTPPGGTR